MKKYKFMCLRIATLFFLALTLFSCKSVPVTNHVNPLDLLDGENSFYLAIPAGVDDELVTQVLQQNVAGLSQKDAQMVLDRIDKIYLGLLSSKKQIQIQSAISCNIPKSFAPKIFTKKRGFEKVEFVSTSESKFEIYDSNSITISLPDSNTLCIGRNIERMLEEYSILSTSSIDEIKSENINSFLEDEFYDYLNTASDSIRFYANKPQSFLTILTGANLDLKLSYVMGEMKIDPKKDTQYILDLSFEFKNERFVKPGKSLLTLAFGLTDSQSEMPTATNLKILGIKINKNQLYKLLTF